MATAPTSDTDPRLRPLSRRPCIGGSTGTWWSDIARSIRQMGAMRANFHGGSQRHRHVNWNLSGPDTDKTECGAEGAVGRPSPPRSAGLRVLRRRVVAGMGNRQPMTPPGPKAGHHLGGRGRRVRRPGSPRRVRPRRRSRDPGCRRRRELPSSSSRSTIRSALAATSAWKFTAPDGGGPHLALEELGDGGDEFGRRRPAGVPASLVIGSPPAGPGCPTRFSHTRRPIAASSTDRVCPDRCRSAW